MCKREKIKKAFSSFFKRYVSVLTICLVAFSAFTGVCYLIACFSSGFADFFQRWPAAFLRFVFAKASNFFPFSLAEVLLLCVPILLIALVIVFLIAFLRNRQKAARALLSSFSGILAFYCLFVWMFGIGCHTTPVHVKLGMERNGVQVEELSKTAEILVQEINQLIPQIPFVPGANSVMPYSLQEMNDMLNTAYQKLHDRYPFIQGMRTNAKSVANSHWMSYTHLTGIYTFYTGEANINAIFPDYTLPYTTAHELAHQRGISREDEAQFIAFLACLQCDDPYIRYSAFLNVYEYVANQLYYVDNDAYFSIASRLSPKITEESKAYVAFFEPYRETKTSEISSNINDAYLKSYGQTEGVRSYGLVVDLTVAYYRQAGRLS